MPQHQQNTPLICMPSKLNTEGFLPNKNILVKLLFSNYQIPCHLNPIMTFQQFKTLIHEARQGSLQGLYSNFLLLH